MTTSANGGDGGGGRRKAAHSDARGPRRDLGPAAREESSFDWAQPFHEWRVADDFTIEAIEIASIRAEEAVQPFLASRRERRFRGVSVVQLRFSDVRTLVSFRRTRSVTSVRGGDAWRLVRRWAGAGDDGGLDEAMCGAAARFLNADFAGLLTAKVVTWIIKDR